MEDRGRKARRARQMTPVSAGRRNAASFFLEEQGRQQEEDIPHVEIEISTDEDEVEGLPLASTTPEGSTGVDDKQGQQGRDSEDWLSRGAAAVSRSLSEAAANLQEEVRPLAPPYDLTDSEEEDDEDDDEGSDSEVREDEEVPDGRANQEDEEVLEEEDGEVPPLLEAVAPVTNQVNRTARAVFGFEDKDEVLFWENREQETGVARMTPREVNHEEEAELAGRSWERLSTEAALGEVEDLAEEEQQEMVSGKFSTWTSSEKRPEVQQIANSSEVEEGPSSRVEAPLPRTK